jgi:hypothetical protein
LHQTAGVPSAIPPAVKQAESHNHIGDPTWDRGDGGRVLLPLECFVSGVGDTCGTGAFGVADPASLGFRYYVKLDPAEIQKAMWAETSPDGSLIWTSSGDDLLAYRSSEVSEANRAPPGPLLGSVRPSTARCHRPASRALYLTIAGCCWPVKPTAPIRFGPSIPPPASDDSNSRCASVANPRAST